MRGKGEIDPGSFDGHQHALLLPESRFLSPQEQEFRDETGRSRKQSEDLLNDSILSRGK